MRQNVLRHLRIAKGHTQQSLAVHSGVSRKHISQIECGKTDPTLKVLSRLAAALEVQLRELLPEGFAAGKRRGEFLKSRHHLPIFQEVVAGNPLTTKQPKQGELAVLPAQFGESRYILRIRDDCMEPQIQRGDLVLVDNTLQAKCYDIVACTVGSRGTLRRHVIRDNVIILLAENSARHTIVVPPRGLRRIHGVVLEIIQRKLR